jgi:capsular exopolysaccharide synthesis family protein
LQAIWHRKSLALFVGLVAAALGGGATMLCLQSMMPGQYTTFALLRVSSVEPRLVFTTSEKESDFKTFRSIQATLIKSPLVLNAALQQPEVEAIPWIAVHPDPVTALDQRLKVDYPGDSEILRLAISGSRPYELATFLNAVVSSYLENIVNQDRALRSARLDELVRIYGESEDKVRDRRDRLARLAEKLGTGDTEVAALKQQLALDHFAEVKREHSRVHFELMRAQAKKQVIEGVDEREWENTQLPDSLINEFINKDPTGSRLLLRVNALSDAVANYERVANDPNELTLVRLREELKRAQSALDQRQTEVRPSVSQRLKVEFFREYHSNEMKSQQDIALLVEQEKQLRDVLAIQTVEIDKLGVSSFELESLRSETDQIEKVAQRIGGEIEALRVELQSPPRVTLIQRAEIPRTQEQDRHTKLALFVAAACFGGVIVLLALWEFSLGRIYRADELKNMLGVRVLGELPPPDRTTRRILRNNRLDRLAFDGTSLESASVICATLLRKDVSRSNRVIMVAGASHDDGKTLLASQLAMGLARAGRRTLLIDGDLVNPQIHSHFGLNRTPGFSELLLGRAELGDVVQVASVPNLFVLVAGDGDRTAMAKALSHADSEHVFHMLRGAFDSIVVDSSPLLASADSLWLGRCADQVLLSVRSGTSRLAGVHAAHERLKRSGIRSVSAVVHASRAAKSPLSIA